MCSKPVHVVIIGNGISGITAARHIRKLSDHQITVISAESDYFFSRTALMYIYMGHMRAEDTKPYEDWFWEKNKINLVRAYVEKIDFDKKQLFFSADHSKDNLKDARNLTYDKLILALGSESNKFGWPGQDLKGVRGLYSYQDLEYMEEYSKGLKRAVIVGGGLIGIEMAEMFHSRQIPVTLLVRESSYWSNILPPEESQMVGRHISNHHIDLRLSAELAEILPDANGRCRAVKTKSGEEIPCGFVGLTVGVHPNVGPFKESSLDVGRGIQVDEYLQTNIADVYAIGDCAELREANPGRRNIEAIWYTGRMMGETVAYTICGQATAYDPGIWFNSAKFLDIEYQVYGNVPNKVPDEMETLYWEHKDGMKSIRVNYHKQNKYVLGFNLMGIRYRHEVCEKWLKNKTNIGEVLVNLGLVNFDPEFYTTYEKELIDLYNYKTGSQLKLKKKRGLDRVLEFLKTS
jgi:NAD(P)H-nitrite reductase large subunit